MLILFFSWGLTTYRETALLVDEKSSSIVSKQWVSIVVSHELAHQWFGNLVTMEWWTDLWLNEGFATWIERFTTDIHFPEWEMWTQFVYQDMGSALDLDALETSHPIEVEVSNPSEIDEIFDEISYSKGSAVIRMLFNFLGKNDFQKGLRDYLNRHQYSNATTEDLWNALGNASNKPVREMMTTWTKQTGFPVLIIDFDENCKKIKIEQKKFLSNGINNDNNDLWYIPIQIHSDLSSNDDNNQSIYLLKEKSAEFDVPSYKEWFKSKFIDFFVYFFVVNCFFIV